MSEIMQCGCRSDNGGARALRVASLITGQLGSAVICRVCGRSGPWAESEPAAVAAWTADRLAEEKAREALKRIAKMETLGQMSTEKVFERVIKTERDPEYYGLYVLPEVQAARAELAALRATVEAQAKQIAELEQGLGIAWPEGLEMLRQAASYLSPSNAPKPVEALQRAASRACDVMSECVEHGECSGADRAEMKAAEKQLLDALLGKAIRDAEREKE